jgi:hypothetical protein
MSGAASPAKQLAERLIAEHPARLAYYERQYGPQTGDGPNAVILARAYLAELERGERLEAERDEARRAHAILVRKIAQFAGVGEDELGLICECGHTHVAGADGEDAGCRICDCLTFDRAALSALIPSGQPAAQEGES